MERQNAIKNTTMRTFLDTIARNPDINTNQMYLKSGLSTCTIMKCREIFRTIGYIKTSQSTIKETRYKITTDGLKFLKNLSMIENIQKYIDDELKNQEALQRIRTAT